MVTQRTLPSRTPQGPGTPTRLTRAPRRPDAEPHVAYPVQVAAAWSWRLLIIAAGLLALGYVLAYFSEILIPVLVAVLVAALLDPLVELMVRRQIPRGLAVAATLVTTLVVVGALLALVGTQIASGLTELSTQALQGLTQVRAWLSEGPLGITNAQLNAYLDQAQAAVSANSQQLATGALSVTTTLGHALAGAFLALFAVIFLLYDGRGIWEWLVRLLPRGAEGPVDRAVQRGWVTLVAYVRATVVVASVDALGIGVGAALLGIPLAVPLAVLVFLGAFVPIVGALVSGAVAVLVGLVAEGPVTALIMLGVVVLVQQLESHVLQPFLLGRAVSVHPLGVIVAIAAGVTLAGIPGALFAVPVVAVLNTVITYLVKGDQGEGMELPEGAEDAPLAPDPVKD
ncbi:AI-2E family transporter [Quadrisphaera sp. DSM 44207]|uniref:AI-2E family transporter n=1 Tax=Quadrisphaera sp. DSM 44207 TaxID=1881057 RepID=UPI001C40B88B|nr:AI-2E family transporter [Quadrisphaera sp. DSM 44207]